MIRFFAPALIISLLACHGEQYEESDKLLPTDHLYWQRAYPDKHLDIRGWQEEFSMVRAHLKNSKSRNAGIWETQGPANLGARINTIAVHPADHNIILIGYSAGGIYRTENGGQSWQPVFDNFPVMAIGDIVFDDKAPDIVYAGTGDPNISGIPFSGNGIYKSTDTGKTWEYLGLKEVGIISEISIDPDNPGILFAASMGVPFYRDDNRGLYKSSDAGVTWTKVLFLGDGTGVIDIALHPSDGNIIYAAGWDRIRNYEESITEGEGARIYKSTDGGIQWTQLSGGLPNRQHSRIGIELSPSNPEKLYAVYVDLDFELEQIYKTANGGETWSAIPTNPNSGMGTQPFLGFGWYFGKIRINPLDEDDLFLLGVRLWRYNDRVRRWQRADQFTADEVHADKHDLWFVNADTLLVATDGGLYKSVDDASSWLDIENIPTTQIYRVAYNPHKPDMYYGGAQDNGSSFGNKSILSDWVQYFSGDGFRTIFHPNDPNIYYVETQLGGLSVTLNGGQSYERATKGIDGSDNINWDAPVIMSRFDPDVLYYGTDRLYRNMTGPDENFVPISPVLTDPEVLLDATSNISVIEESPFDPSSIYVGTGDGNLYRTLDLGIHWEKVDVGLPDRYITAITHSMGFDSVLYVTHSGYKSGEKLAHVHRSDDQGEHWHDITGDLPPLPVNDILVLPNNNDQVLFVGTDVGVYLSRDAGSHWIRLGNNMPLVPVFDLEYNPDNNLLIAGTHAKSIMTFDLDQEGIDGQLGVGIHEQIAGSLTLYPNPAREYLHLVFDISSARRSSIRVINIKGEIVMQKGLIDNTVDIRELLPGTYQIVLQNQSMLWVGSFIKL
ncbi:MAG: T9SS type A sorting domain-containing protein [Saprospiraceae bacterium]|nr:T9SS type A sorting domain-containing protein [Saprospiraceae bacterium]